MKNNRSEEENTSCLCCNLRNCRRRPNQVVQTPLLIKNYHEKRLVLAGDVADIPFFAPRQTSLKKAWKIRVLENKNNRIAM